MPPDPDMTQSADDRVSKWKKGFIDTDTDDQINVAREEFTEKVVAESWVAATVSVSLHPLVIRNISEYNTFRICQCSDLVYAGLRPRTEGRVPCSGPSSANRAGETSS